MKLFGELLKSIYHERPTKWTPEKYGECQNVYVFLNSVGRETWMKSGIRKISIYFNEITKLDGKKYDNLRFFHFTATVIQIVILWNLKKKAKWVFQ